MKRTYDINSILGRIPGNEAFYAQQDANEQNKERINKQIIDTYGPSYGEYHKEARILRDHLSIKAAEITNEYLQKTAEKHGLNPDSYPIKCEFREKIFNNYKVSKFSQDRIKFHNDIDKYMLELDRYHGKLSQSTDLSEASKIGNQMNDYHKNYDIFQNQESKILGELETNMYNVEYP